MPVHAGWQARRGRQQRDAQSPGGQRVAPPPDGPGRQLLNCLQYCRPQRLLVEEEEGRDWRLVPHWQPTLVALALQNDVWLLRPPASCLQSVPEK